MTRHRLQAERSQLHSKISAVIAGFACALLLVACATPDLKPFADASKTLSTSVASGGKLAIAPLTREPLWDGSRFVQPDEANHPARMLTGSWDLRQKSMDAVLVYSASIAAISDAAAHRNENAAAVAGSVKQLASAIPALGTGVSAAGDLIVFGLKTYVEVKAWHDMQQAIAAADPAIQLVAKALKEDFAELANLYEITQRNQMIQKINALRPVERVHDAIQAQQTAQRANVAAAPSDKVLGAELVRLDALLSGVASDLNKLRTEKAAAENLLGSGREFFAAAIKAVDAWANAHADLVRSFEQNRSPNLVLLAARAEDLKGIVDKLKK